MKKKFKRKILATIIFSIIAAVILIVHGLFLDLDITQVSRLTLGGFIATFVLVFVGLLILEWIPSDVPIKARLPEVPDR